MSEEFEITMQTKAEDDLLDLVKIHIGNFASLADEEVNWNEVFTLHGAISGALNRYQSLPREKA